VLYYILYGTNSHIFTPMDNLQCIFFRIQTDNSCIPFCYVTIFSQMLCGRFPFWGKTDIAYLASLEKGPDITGDGWASVSNDGKMFLLSLLNTNATERLSASDALEHPWMLAEIDDCQDGSLRKLESQAGIAAVVQTRRAPGLILEADLSPKEISDFH
jgi:serine/threonine protein kinase